MEIGHLKNINLAEVLPRINDINVLPFGVVEMDLTGKILGYNMAEAELMGTDPAWALGTGHWALGKNFQRGGNVHKHSRFLRKIC